MALMSFSRSSPFTDIGTLNNIEIELAIAEPSDRQNGRKIRNL